MRKLASIRKIKQVLPIENADLLELAIVDGWKIVIKKGEYLAGDYCIYCEIDSLLPIKDEYEFLRKSSYVKFPDGTDGFRIKTIRLRGQVSQGLILPIYSLPENTSIEEGLDVTEIMDVVKYEQPIHASLSGLVKGGFPSFLRKTDEERIQNLVNDYQNWLMENKDFYATEKMDGSSATFYYNDNVFGVCSRNLELLENDGNTFWDIAKSLDLKNKLSSLNRNICIQGELIGPGVNKNIYNLKKHNVLFFNAFDIDTQNKLPLSEFIELIESLGLETVPIFHNFELPSSIDELLVISDGKSIINSNVDREGIVIRSYDMDISFKVISNKFLLNEK
jgi:RNA ligase (TIGR02306 family)